MACFLSFPTQTATFCRESNFPKPPLVNARLRELPSEFCNAVCTRKLTWRPYYVVKSLMIYTTEPEPDIRPEIPYQRKCSYKKKIKVPQRYRASACLLGPCIYRGFVFLIQFGINENGKRNHTPFFQLPYSIRNVINGLQTYFCIPHCVRNAKNDSFFVFLIDLSYEKWEIR